MSDIENKKLLKVLLSVDRINRQCGGSEYTPVFFWASENNEKEFLYYCLKNVCKTESDFYICNAALSELLIKNNNSDDLFKLIEKYGSDFLNNNIFYNAIINKEESIVNFIIENDIFSIFGVDKDSYDNTISSCVSRLTMNGKLDIEQFKYIASVIEKQELHDKSKGNKHV